MTGLLLVHLSQWEGVGLVGPCMRAVQAELDFRQRLAGGCIVEGALANAVLRTGIESSAERKQHQEEHVAEDYGAAIPAGLGFGWRLVGGFIVDGALDNADLFIGV